MNASSESGECASLISCVLIVACRAGMRFRSVSTLLICQAACLNKASATAPRLGRDSHSCSVAEEEAWVLDRLEDRIRAGESLAYLRCRAKLARGREKPRRKNFDYVLQLYAPNDMQDGCVHVNPAVEVRLPIFFQQRHIIGPSA